MKSYFMSYLVICNLESNVIFARHCSFLWEATVFSANCLISCNTQSIQRCNMRFVFLFLSSLTVLNMTCLTNNGRKRKPFRKKTTYIYVFQQRTWLYPQMSIVHLPFLRIDNCVTWSGCICTVNCESPLGFLKSLGHIFDHTFRTLHYLVVWLKRMMGCQNLVQTNNIVLCQHTCRCGIHQLYHHVYLLCSACNLKSETRTLFWRLYFLLTTRMGVPLFLSSTQRHLSWHLKLTRSLLINARVKIC